MVYLFIIAGGVIGAMLLEAEGILPGFLLGYLFYRSQRYKDQLSDLTSQVSRLENKLQAIAPSPPEAAEQAEPMLAQDPVATDTPPVADPGDVYDTGLFETPKTPVSATPQEIEQTDEPLFAPIPEAPIEEPVFASASQQQDKPPAPNTFLTDDVLGEWVERIKGFFLGGNLFVRLGVAVLFIGLSFLVKEAIQGGFIPIELRLAGAFLIGTILIFIGWKLTKDRPGYGLTLQGGGIAILYLTIFAGFRLYDLIDAQTAFIFLVVITILGTAIAILQNAQSLAVISLLGGFMAPVITSTGSGDHVALFSYYAVLNAGVFFMAWRKPWRTVHLTGFFSTFVIGAAWGASGYTAELFSTTEPFLILFFAMYLGIALMYAMRHGLEPKKIVDGTLIFGLPVIAFSIQAVLVEPYEYGLAWSALVMGGCYALVAWFINKRNRALMGTLTEALAGVSLALLSMTIPFALDATWTGAGWALEGAALVWLGIRQNRLLVRLGGLLLTALASASFVYGLQETSYEVFSAYRFMINPSYMGFFTLSVSALFAGYQIDKNRDKLFKIEGYVSVILLAAGVMWWLAGGHEEIRREFTSAMRQHLQLCFMAGSTLIFALVGKRINWNGLVKSSLVLIPLLYWFFMANLIVLSHAFKGWGSLAWLVAAIGTYTVLYLNEGSVGKRLSGFAHAASLWLFTLLLTSEGVWFMEQQFDYQSAWPVLSLFVVPVAVIAGVTWLSNGTVWPVVKHQGAYLKTALIPIMLAVWYLSMMLSFEHAGNPAPLPYLPLLNPIDIMLGFSVFAGLYWYKTVDKVDANFFSKNFLGTNSWQWLKWALIVSGFVWMNATIGRSVHHWTDVRYGESLLNSSAFQSAISICWTLLALTAMTYSARRESRTPWFASAGLLAVVIVKLFVIDLSNLTTIHRVISFIVVGVLLLVIGYLAPVPPKKDEQPAEVTDA